ncbi:MAG: hypothetical protein ISR64_03895 [Deltaproteobacteria bacterium]|nr:hypothetical protein [Deltaproteobacteria bacterium]
MTTISAGSGRPALALILTASLAVWACGNGSSDDTGTPGDDIPAADAADVTDSGTTADAADTGILSDIDWQALPRLPSDKTFTTRYAAGVASRIVTSDHPIYMGGFGFCGGAEELCRETEGVHDDLYVQVVAIADPVNGEVVMLSGLDSVGLLHYDHNVMGDRVQRELYDKHGVFFEGNRLLISSSHAHSTPDTAGLWGPMFGYGRDDVYAEFLRDQTVAAAVEAYENLADIEMEWAMGHSPNHTDGSNPETDDNIYVIIGKKPGGETVFTLTRWNAHPTAYGSDMNGQSSDYLGPFRLRMEEEFGGTAVFLNGCIGGTYPERPSECGLTKEAYPDGWMDPDLSDTSHMKVTCTGYLVADNAIKAVNTGTQPVAETGIDFRHTVFGFHPENELLMMMANTAPVPWEWVDIDDPLSELITEFGWARVGDLNFLGTPGESFPEFGNKAAGIMAAKGYHNAIVLGLTQDWLGYILIEEQWLDPKLSYNQGLSVGKDIDPAFMAELEAILP